MGENMDNKENDTSLPKPMSGGFTIGRQINDLNCKSFREQNI